MQVVILCGGSGTRLREQTEFIPKPLIPIGGKPMIWHIMKLYAHYGFNDFILALGYKQEEFKKYFSLFDVINEDVLIRTGWRYNKAEYIHFPKMGDQWNITLVDTGEDNFKGSRLKQVEKYVTDSDDVFMCTYGDGIGDIDIPGLLEFHKENGKMVTITGVHPAPKYGDILHKNNKVLSFTEKPTNDGLVNGGFMVMNREIFKYLVKDLRCDLERGPFEVIAAKGEMMVYPHHGYWGSMDTIFEMHELDQLWRTGQAKWRVW